MTLWSVTQNIPESLGREVNLENMLGLIPVWSLSSDVLAIKLVKLINGNLKQYNFFPKIGSSPASGAFPMGRLQEFSKYPLEEKEKVRPEKETVRHKKIYDIV